MIDGIVAGKLHGKAKERTGNSGKPFVTCMVRVATEADPLFVSAIAFDADVCRALLALDDKDTVALSGSLTPKTYVPKDGSPARPALDMVASAVLTPYHIKRKRLAAESQSA